MNKKRAWIWFAIAGGAFLAGLICLFFIWNVQNQKQQAAQEYEAIRKEAKVSSTPAPAGQPDESADLPAEEEPLEIPVDFKALEEMNSDIYAWITVPGTAIDYPVVQHLADNSYYLNHTVEREEQISGSIFSEKENSIEFSDKNTVLYGHNMRDGSMFADLHKFEDNTFFNEHREVKIYTPDAIRTYHIFAAYLYDDRHLLQSVDYEDDQSYENYLNEVLTQRSMRSNVDTSVELSKDSRIITLSTCHSMGDHYRYLVQAVLVDELK